MEDCKTKYIESSLAAFRAIKTFVFIKGIYPRNFNTLKSADKKFRTFLMATFKTLRAL